MHQYPFQQKCVKHSLIPTKDRCFFLTVVAVNSNQNILRKFDEEMENLRNYVLKMGGLVEQQIRRATDALKTLDDSEAEAVVLNDKYINELEVSIDEECARILLRRQLASSDLRMVVTVIKTITDLERIGDEAEKIGRFALKLANSHEPRSYYTDILHLGDTVIKMLHDSLNAFARKDIEMAVEIASRDPEVDQEFERLSRMLMTHMMEDPREIRDVLRINWCARSLERVGDHSSNICEYVIYLVKGMDVRHISLEQIQERVGKNKHDR